MLEEKEFNTTDIYVPVKRRRAHHGKRRWLTLTDATAEDDAVGGKQTFKASFDRFAPDTGPYSRRLREYEYGPKRHTNRTLRRGRPSRF